MDIDGFLQDCNICSALAMEPWSAVLLEAIDMEINLDNLF